MPASRQAGGSLPLPTMGASLGGNVRVGLRNSLYLGKETMVTSCAEQVRKIRRIPEQLPRTLPALAKRGPCWCPKDGMPWRSGVFASSSLTHRRLRW